jgi:hypothetical protein
MKLTSTLLALLAVVSFLMVSEAQAATIVFDNLNATSNAAYGIRDSGGTLVSGSGFQGALGRFSITNSAISSSFAGNDLVAIQNAFSQFDPLNGTFLLDSFGPGAFQASESFDTKASSNSFGGSVVYAVLYKGTSIATATELFIAEMNAVFPTDPAEGLALTSSISLRPDTIANLLVGTSGGPQHDYGIGGGALPTFGLVAAVPEPTRSWLLVLGLMGACLRRRR